MAASHTTNLGLNKPARTDLVSVVTDINENMDMIDDAIGALPSGSTVMEEIAKASGDSDLGFVETGDTATHAISKGLYVMWKNVLCTADADITVGTTLKSSSGSGKNLTVVNNGGLNDLKGKTVKLGDNAESAEIDCSLFPISIGVKDISSNNTYYLMYRNRQLVVHKYNGETELTMVNCGIEKKTTNDLNYETYQGAYEIIRGSGATNFPDDSGDAFLFVNTSETSSENMSQVYINKTTGAMYSRVGHGSTWSDWKRALTDDDVANNLTTTAAGKVLDARQGKELDDKITALQDGLENGTYEELTAGNAQFLLSDKGETDNDLYVFRKTGGKKRAYGREMLRKITGGTVAWNQLVQNGNFADTSAWAIRNSSQISVSGNVGTITPGSSNTLNILSDCVNNRQQHKLLVSVDVKSSDTIKITMQNNFIRYTKSVQGDGTWIKSIGIYISAESIELLCFANTTSVNAYQLRNIVVFDLTAMFGSTIADALYAMERATAGSGVAWFRKLFPKDYYAYDTGSLQSVQAKEHKTYDENDNLIASYPLDSDLELRGIPKLDSGNNMYYDGDEYTPDGTVTRKYGIVDLGTLDWARYASSDVESVYFFVSSVISDMKVQGNNGIVWPNLIISNGYFKTYASSIYGGIADNKSYAGYDGLAIRVRDDSYTDATTYKTAMSGVYLVYELATPTTESADPYRELEICSEYGTEEFVDAGVTASTPTRDVAIPVSAETFYPVDPVVNVEENKADMIVVMDDSSAAVKSFPDGAKKQAMAVKVGIEPVQDLHGYDNPWPGGAGKNLFDVSKVTNTDCCSISGETVTNTAVDNRNTFNFMLQLFNGSTFIGQTPVVIVQSVGRVSTTIELTTGLVNRLVIKHSGGIQDISFSYPFTQIGTFTVSLDVTGYNPSVVGGLVFKNIQIESGSSMTSYAPYANICPITGWTGAKVTRTGFNQWDEQWEPGTYNDDTGEPVSSNNIIRNKNMINCFPNTTYYFKCTHLGVFFFYDKNMNVILPRMVVNANNTFVTPNNAYYMKFRLSLDYGAIYKNNICINISDPSRNGEYEPYAGQEYSITFPSEAGTVYGGTLTINKDGTGTLAINMASVDMGTLTYHYASDAGLFFSDEIADMLSPSTVDLRRKGIISSCYPVSTGTIIDSSMDNKSMLRAGKRIYIRDDSYNTASAFATAMSGMQLVYELSAIITYILTAAQIKSLLGMNNIWADTGDILGCEYAADTKLYIEKLTKPTEDDMTANNTIASEKFFMVGNGLYYSTSQILAGDKIIPGTNCTALSLADALNNLNT